MHGKWSLCTCCVEVRRLATLTLTCCKGVFSPATINFSNLPQITSVPPLIFARDAGGTGAVAAAGGQGAAEAQGAAVANAGVGGRGAKAVLEGLEELWDEAQYAEELSLDAFVNKLR